MRRRKKRLFVAEELERTKDEVDGRHQKNFSRVFLKRYVYLLHVVVNGDFFFGLSYRYKDSGQPSVNHIALQHHVF